MVEEKYKSKIHERYAKEQAAKRAQYKDIIGKVADLSLVTIAAVISVTVFAIASFPQDIPVIGLITIIYSGVIFIGISLYHNKKKRELAKH
jgi:hypothetical protein